MSCVTKKDISLLSKKRLIFNENEVFFSIFHGNLSSPEKDIELIFSLFAFIDKLADKQCNKTVESVFLIADVIMTQNFLKFIDDLVFGSEVSKIPFT